MHGAWTLGLSAGRPPAACQPRAAAAAAAVCNFASRRSGSLAPGWCLASYSSSSHLAARTAAPYSSAAGQRPPRSPLQPPTEPDPSECCGRGCSNCVWTVYLEELQEHQAALAAAAGEPPPEDPFEALERRLAQQAAGIAAMPSPQEQAAAQKDTAAASAEQQQQQQQQPSEQHYCGLVPPELALHG